MFIPINNHIEIEPIVQESIIASQENNFEEKGKVLSVAIEVTKIKIGDVVFFDSWLCAKYPDIEGKVRYLVPIDAVRAKESVDNDPISITNTHT